MPILAKSVSSSLMTSGDTLTVVNEASPFTIPPCWFYGFTSQIPYAFSEEVVPLGSRVAFSTTTSEFNSKHQLVPIFLCHRGALKGAQPYRIYPLQNAVDITVTMDPTTEFFHLHWWWNAWSPDWVTGFSEIVPQSPPEAPPSPPGSPPSPSTYVDYYRTHTLPVPPVHRYQAHTVPSLDNPPFLLSLAPRTIPGAFDPRRPFWVAPIAEGYLCDLMSGWPKSLEISFDPNRARLPDTPGARLVLDMLKRGILEYPRENNTTLPPDPATEPDLSPSGKHSSWVLRGGIVGAQKHVELDSAKDNPVFVSSVRSGDLASFPDDLPIPLTCTVQDHAVVVRALKAHVDHRALSNASRVLMHAKGQLVRGKFKPRATRLKKPNGEFFGVSWPAQEQEGNETPVLILDHPTPVFWNMLTNNYRMMLNEDKVLYKEMDFPEFTFFNTRSSFLNMGSTAHRDFDPQLDYVLSDPHDFYQPDVYDKSWDRSTL